MIQTRFTAISSADFSWNSGTLSDDYAASYKYDLNGNLYHLSRNGYAGSGNLAMDELSYTYQTGTNKLLQVTDPVSATNYANDFDGTSNYTYDELGQLMSDSGEEIDEIQWTVSGKVKRITRTSTSTKDDLSFEYDAMGQRIMKTVYPKSAPGVVDLANVKSYYYIRDAQGNTMALYNFKNNEFTLAEQYMYGSARLGVTNRGVLIDTPADTMNYVTVYNTLGEKQYELANHLGNVLVTVSDKKIVEPNGSMTEVAYYHADVSSANDYYPFGMQMEGRSYQSSAYRYGFGGQEKDNEVSGDGSSYTAEFWQYDSRLGRRWNVDPMSGKYSWQSPYSAFNNNPVYFTDSKGLEGEEGNKKVQKHTISTGETLTGIANQYNTSVETLAKWNNISDVNKIVAGDELIVSDPTRPAQRSSFESYPKVEESTGWTTSKPGIQETTVNSGLELGLASVGNYEIANLGGGLLDAVKSDPDMVAYQEEILANVKANPKYGKEAFYISGFDVREFGGKRGAGNDWFSFGDNDPVLKKETWQVAANQLTWALRHATVKYWAEVGKDGTIKLQFRLYDTLDLSGSGGRSGTYNTISEFLGFFYHDLAGGNKNLQTRAKWTITK